VRVKRKWPHEGVTDEIEVVDVAPDNVFNWPMLLKKSPKGDD
jgi:hypothetical protein